MWQRAVSISHKQLEEAVNNVIYWTKKLRIKLKEANSIHVNFINKKHDNVLVPVIILHVERRQISGYDTYDTCEEKTPLAESEVKRFSLEKVC